MRLLFAVLPILAAEIGLTQPIAPHPTQSPDPQATLLWRSGEGGYDTYRIPGIVAAADGTVLAYAVGRVHIQDGDWSDSDILLRRSTDGGQSWSPSQRVAGDGHGVTDNPVAIASSRRGVVHLLYQHNYATLHYMRSNDDGAHFSQPVDITAAVTGLRDAYPWTVVALGPGHAIQTKNGRLLVPVWLAAGKDTGNGRRQHAPSAITTIYSDDDGSTWHHGVIIATDSPVMHNPNEFQLVQLADGKVMANIRTGDPALRRAIATSPDGISGWSKPVFDRSLFDPICAAGIVRYDASTLLFTNPDSERLPLLANGTRGPRHELTIYLSHDEGSTWPVKKLLIAGPVGYSDIAVDTHKSVYDIFEGPAVSGSKALSIFVSTFKLAWLTTTDPK